MLRSVLARRTAHLAIPVLIAAQASECHPFRNGCPDPYTRGFRSAANQVAESAGVLREALGRLDQGLESAAEPRTT